MRLVFDYRSFRDFLKDYYKLQKDKNRSFSYSVFARQCGLSSAAHIQLILSGKRNLTVQNIHRVADALSLPLEEREFFETLVHLNQAETHAEKKFYERRLRQMQIDKPRSSARLKVSSLLGNAYFPALLLSVDGKEMEEAISAASVRFSYSRNEITKLLEQFRREGVIELVDGRIQLSQRHLILHDKKASSQAQKSSLLQQLRLSLKAFEERYDRDAKFYSHTFTMAEAAHERCTMEIHELIERITKISDEEPGEEVMQINVQLFPYCSLGAATGSKQVKGT